MNEAEANANFKNAIWKLMSELSFKDLASDAFGIMLDKYEMPNPCAEIALTQGVQSIEAQDLNGNTQTVQYSPYERYHELTIEELLQYRSCDKKPIKLDWKKFGF